MKRFAIIGLLLFAPGCAWFVPSQIKKEASLMKIDSKTAITEISAIDTTKPTVIIDVGEGPKEMPTAEAVKQKALKSLNRTAAHAEVFDAYMKGQQAPRMTTPVIKESEIK